MAQCHYTCIGASFVFSPDRKNGATNATTVAYFISVFAVLWDYTFLDELLQTHTLIAAVIIFTGTAMITGVLKQKKVKTLWMIDKSYMY